MEAPGALTVSLVMNAGDPSCADGSEQLSNGVKGSENLGDDLLEDLDSYLEDINDRLTISRMVSDSVIKGMVFAVEQEAMERIAAKELEVLGLKETLNFYSAGADKNNSIAFQVASHEPKSTRHGSYSSFSGTLEEHDRMRELLRGLRNAAKEQFKRLKKEIDLLKGCSTIKGINSSSDVVGLGGILQEKPSERWTDIDKTLQTLKLTVEATYKQVDDMVYLSKASFSEWQRELEFQREVEAMVVRNSIQSLHKDLEEKLWDQNDHFCGSQSENLLGKMNEISSLRQELDAISKSLSIHEIGHLTSHGFENNEEGTNAKRTNPFNRKILSNHITSGTSLCEGNGNHGDSKISFPENLESSQLKHMSKEELFNYFKIEVTKMKRNHESQVQEMTEEYFSLKREFFKERGSSLALRKDKEFDLLRKKIPEFTSKLDCILVGNEKLPSFSNNTESLSSLKDRLSALFSENCQLRDSLTDMRKEVKCLTLLVSDAEEKMSRHSLTEANLLKIIGNLECAIDDAHMEALVSEEVYKCILREVADHIKCKTREADLESIIMREITFEEAVRDTEATIECDIEDSYVESVIMQGLCTVIFQQAFKDAEAELGILEMKFTSENERKILLETKTLEVEKALSLEVEEKERLKQEILQLVASMEEKNKWLLEVAAASENEKKQFELASLELHSLREQVNQLQVSISAKGKESDSIKGELAQALEKVELYNGEIRKLKKKIELAMKQFREADEERRILVQEKQSILSSVEAKEVDNKNKMETISILTSGLLKVVADFDIRVAEAIERNSSRLENSISQLSFLIQKADTLRKARVLYKQRFERRCSDLQKAESEVDLLGDEVDALLSLLEKIYIALDHYSPILQHYPGIMDILKLIRRELSGESTKQV